MSSELEKLGIRVAAGITWLDENDPGSVFHLWFEAGLTPMSRMPAQDDDTRARYREYYAARSTFERLDREYSRLGGYEPTRIGSIDWNPPKEKR